MINLEQLKQITVKTDSKIVLLVMDGLGGLPDPETNKTELETAKTPNLDYLAKHSICGLCDPISPGITPGSGPGHLALFGYEPLKLEIGRGVLEALGIDFNLQKQDVAARGNFCTVDNQGVITDRRAGRISTEKCKELCEILNDIKLENTQIYISPVKEHRFLFVMRNDKLTPKITDTDPQKIGTPPVRSEGKGKQEEYTANIVNTFVQKASRLLAKYHPANMLLLRGFSSIPVIPSMEEIYKLKPAAIASYPMYKGLAKLVGMQILNSTKDIQESIKILADNYEIFDYFFIHVKDTDSAGEDGDFNRKVSAIEKVDKVIPQLLGLKPDVFMLTGDHSTPAILRAHSWHPVPFLLYSKWCRPDKVNEFSESACLSGGLGRFSSIDIMPLAMANALKLAKFGA